MVLIIILVLILLILITIIGFYIHIKKKIESYSVMWFGTKNLLEGINKQKIEFESNPKAIYGMDSLLSPEISKDFPCMNIDEMKRVAEENIISFLNSINEKNMADIPNISNKLKLELRDLINNASKENVGISNINIHKTVINKYNKTNGLCTLTFQTGLNYIKSAGSESNKIEDRINTEFIYIYDDKNVRLNEPISLNCPNCGAPIKGLGHKTCPYCNVGLIDLAPKIWKFNNLTRS